MWRILEDTMGPIKNKSYPADYTHTHTHTLVDEINASDESELQESL